MLGRLRVLLCFILPIIILGLSQAQELISPAVFLRGLELANGVRYTASFIKPTDDTILRNLSVEITLPADAQFLEMLVSRQVQFDVIRRNQQGQLTLIWQISRIDAETPLDAFSFLVAEPLSSELEFYMFWQDEQGQSFLENFFELPSTIRANETEASISPISQNFAFVGNTGIQVAANQPNPLNFRILANNFNPPAEYGSIWWCSLVELSGLAEGDSVMVLVPLRRPVAPFTELILFQQQSDGSWLALDEKGIVTADGQFVMYRHLGGLIATGGDEDIQQEVVPVEQAVIQEAPPPQENPQPQNNEQQPPPAPIENNVVVVQPSPVPQENSVNTGGNQENPQQNNPEPSPVPPTNVPAPTQVIRDGTSNTVQLGESSPIPQATQVNQDSTVRTVPTATSFSTINDGSSNTIIIGERNLSPTAASTDGLLPFIPTETATSFSTINDGSSNTIIIGERNLSPTAASTDGLLPFIPTETATSSGTITDGSSNTIIIGERNLTPTPASTDGLLPFIPTETPTSFSTINDGSSNTIIIGERNLTPTIATTDGLLPFIPTETPTSFSTINDGSSNTIIIGERNLTPTPASTDGLLPFIPTETATSFSTINDGSSNTIQLGESTVTPTAFVAESSEESVQTNPTEAPSATVAPVVAPTEIVIISPPPFGSGGVRIVIVQTNNAGLVQCQVGNILCASLNRRAGNGLR